MDELFIKELTETQAQLMSISDRMTRLESESEKTETLARNADQAARLLREKLSQIIDGNERLEKRFDEQRSIQRKFIWTMIAPILAAIAMSLMNLLK